MMQRNNMGRSSSSRWSVNVGLFWLLIFVFFTGCSPAWTSSSAPAVHITPLALTPGASTSDTAGVKSTDWTMYHRDLTHTGAVPTAPDARRLTRLWDMRLDGAVYAEPLVVGERVLVATEGNSLYALNKSTGKLQWRLNVGKPVPLSTLPCGNIDPLGITGTPVYDPATRLVFAVAEVMGPAHILVGVDVDSGQVRVRRQVDIAGMEPRTQQQRAALILSGGRVYMTFGGLYGDCGNYHGWVVASRTDGQGALLSYRVPTTREGGIWAPPGPAVDAAGHLYVSVGNGEATQGNWDHSDSVLRLSPDLRLEDGFAPKQWQQENAQDSDLGSLGPMLLPQGLIFIAGKSGLGYLLHASVLGGVGGQALVQPVCNAYGGAALLGSQLFVPCIDGLLQLKVGPGVHLTSGWQSSGRGNGSPIVGGHTVYTLDRAGTLYALNSETGALRTSLSVGPVSRFATPTLSGTSIFVGTLKGIAAASIG